MLRTAQNLCPGDKSPLEEAFSFSQHETSRKFPFLRVHRFNRLRDTLRGTVSLEALYFYQVSYSTKYKTRATDRGQSDADSIQPDHPENLKPRAGVPPRPRLSLFPVDRSL